MSKANLKTVGLVALGVMVAGGALYLAGNLPGVREARMGLGGQSKPAEAADKKFLGIF